MRLADRLAAARRRRFVGRGAELARFGELLGGGDAPRVVLVHGPGGVGKTALLHQFAWLAEQAGRRCVWLDGREVPPDATVVLGLLDGDVAPGVVVPSALCTIPTCGPPPPNRRRRTCSTCR